MNAPKAFASLSSGLLARKGSARPAMRRQNYGEVSTQGLDDLGWNDMGFDTAPSKESEDASVENINRNPVGMLSPSEPVVHDQQAKIAEQFGPHEEGDEKAQVYDGADLDDDTAEPWDPEADEAPNAFVAHRGLLADLPEVLP